MQRATIQFQGDQIIVVPTFTTPEKPEYTPFTLAIHEYGRVVVWTVAPNPVVLTEFSAEKLGEFKSLEALTLKDLRRFQQVASRMTLDGMDFENAKDALLQGEYDDMIARQEREVNERLDAEEADRDRDTNPFIGSDTYPPVLGPLHELRQQQGRKKHKPCEIDGCEGHHCRVCGGHTLAFCDPPICDGCQQALSEFAEHPERFSPEEAARLQRELDREQGRKTLGQSGNFTVVGTSPEGTVICRPEGTKGEADYDCGESLEEFGIDDLSDDEKRAVGLLRPLTLNPLGANQIDAAREGGVDDLDR